MNAGLFGISGGGGGIKSIQRGTVSLTGTASTATVTISPVNTSKAMLSFLGFTSNGNAALGESLTRIALTDSTTITATRELTGNSFINIVSWELVEVY